MSPNSDLSPAPLGLGETPRFYLADVATVAAMLGVTYHDVLPLFAAEPISTLLNEQE